MIKRKHVLSLVLLIGLTTVIYLCIHYPFQREPNIFVAIKNNNLQGVEYFLKKDKNSVNAPTENGKTPLILAIESTHEPLVALLLSYDASTNIPCYEGPYKRYPLMIAARKGLVSIAEMLIRKGADIYARDSESEMFHCGMSTIALALKSKSLEMIQLLLDEDRVLSTLSGKSATAMPNDFVSRGVHLLTYAIIMDSPLNIIELLVVYGSNINGNGSGWGKNGMNYPSPLMIAAEKGNIEVVKFLLKAGADVSKTLHGKTALDFAQEADNHDIAALLKAAEKS